MIGKIAHFGRHGGHACQGRLGAQSTINGLSEMFSKRLVIVQAMQAQCDALTHVIEPCRDFGCPIPLAEEIQLHGFPIRFFIKLRGLWKAQWNNPGRIDSGHQVGPSPFLTAGHQDGTDAEGVRNLMGSACHEHTAGLDEKSRLP